MSALINVIEDDRIKVRASIDANLKLPTDSYSFSSALAEVEQYNSKASLLGAVVQLVQQTGTALLDRQNKEQIKKNSEVPLVTNHRYVFTLIHKFQTPEMLCDRPDVIVLTDEAHASQYETRAL